MTRDALVERIGKLANAVIFDPRFVRDDLSVEVLGMLLYGYALGTGRLLFFLDQADIDTAVSRVMTEWVGAAAKWSGGLVAEANAAAFNPDYHPAYHELIGVGHSYLGVEDQVTLVDSVFANIASVRRRTG